MQYWCANKDVALTIKQPQLEGISRNGPINISFLVGEEDQNQLQETFMRVRKPINISTGIKFNSILAQHPHF